MTQKAVNVKAKAGLQFSAIIWDADFCCPKSHCFSDNIVLKMQIQETTAKNFHLEDSKVKEIKPTLSQVAEVGKVFK